MPSRGAPLREGEGIRKGLKPRQLSQSKSPILPVERTVVRNTGRGDCR
jgi:hypothetical protein